MSQCSIASHPCLGVPVARPPWGRIGSEIESSLRKALYEFRLLENVEKVAVALSGGKDSLALLFLLHAIRGRGFPNFDLVAIHISGEFSCGAGVDASFLRGICNGLDVPLMIRISTQTREGLECYSCSRERRRLLFHAAKEVGITTIAFGHHRDDSVQTLLMNLLQKGEFAANLPKVPMERYGVTIIRPLIYVQEEQIRTFAEQHGFLRISCRCPVGQNSKRKQVAQLVHAMEELFPHAKSNLATAGLLYGSQKALIP
jgi:tRNA 2-thiocytidine biosynthesis protein TtcA